MYVCVHRHRPCKKNTRPVAAVNDNDAEMQETMQPLAKQKQTMVRKNKELQQENRLLKQTVDETKKSNQILEETNKNLNQKNQDLENRLKSLDDGRNEPSTSSAELKCSKGLEKELQQKNKALEDMTVERDKLRDELNKKDVELVRVQTDLKHISEQKDKNETELERVKAEAEKYRSERDKTALELARTEATMKFLHEDKIPSSGKKQGGKVDKQSGRHVLRSVHTCRFVGDNSCLEISPPSHQLKFLSPSCW